MPKLLLKEKPNKYSQANDQQNNKENNFKTAGQFDFHGGKRMKYCILMGSPRKNGNTAALLRPFIEELTAGGAECDLIWLYDKVIHPCVACRVCQSQKNWSVFGCQITDDVQKIAEKVLACDVIILATPIYSFYCTAPMKALIDRLVYGMNKVYDEIKGPVLWAGKKLALITTSGFSPKKGADLWQRGIKRYCKHSQLTYLGMFAERHRGYKFIFMDAQKEIRARKFARKLNNILI